MDAHAHALEQEAGADTMIIRGDDQNGCVRAVAAPCEADTPGAAACGTCTYYISVYSFTASSFSITARAVGVQRVVMQEGVPVQATLAANSYQYFDFELSRLDVRA